MYTIINKFKVYVAFRMFKLKGNMVLKMIFKTIKNNITQDLIYSN